MEPVDPKIVIPFYSLRCIHFLSGVQFCHANTLSSIISITNMYQVPTTLRIFIEKYEEIQLAGNQTTEKRAKVSPMKDFRSPKKDFQLPMKEKDSSENDFTFTDEDSTLFKPLINNTIADDTFELKIRC